ncbi:MAG: carboxylating nicotinate-nucleotide diphosphorylase [Leptospira sp.]|nr:carboxylating nicotinate-nucleotide diphosphorylase [Leptospira sp.]
MENSLDRGYTTPISSINPQDFYPLLDIALLEDAPNGDVTTDSLFSAQDQSLANLVSRETGILCGMGVLDAINQRTGDHLSIQTFLLDGDSLSPGYTIATIKGPTYLLLRLERILLNFIQYLSGIASETNRLVASYPDLNILDTRKTVPGYRKLAKYAVFTGGGWNHRINLSDMAMIKDNHISALGSITKAVERVRSRNPDTKIELEIDNLQQLDEAINSNPDILLLDNFSIDDLEIAVKEIRNRKDSILIESSGGVTPEKLESMAKLKNIGVSMGYLTHTTRFLDIGLDMENI